MTAILLVAALTATPHDYENPRECAVCDQASALAGDIDAAADILDECEYPDGCYPDGEYDPRACTIDLCANRGRLFGAFRDAVLGMIDLSECVRVHPDSCMDRHYPKICLARDAGAGVLSRPVPPGIHRMGEVLDVMANAARELANSPYCSSGPGMCDR